ncbi:AAA family ATPase [Halobaculum sp. MBLA0147]|uniref:AAA family ATPase n=1 Tax=Halobaculum sp. MBLA0147 TaxID=3079934 RepID=UPI00352653CA
MSSTTASSGIEPTLSRVIEHFAKIRLQQAEGALPLGEVTADAVAVIERSPENIRKLIEKDNRITVRDGNIISVSVVGQTPQIVREYLGESVNTLDTEQLIPDDAQLPAGTLDSFNSYEEIAQESDAVLFETILSRVDDLASDPSYDFDFLTEAEQEDLEEADEFDSALRVVHTDHADIADLSPTLTTSKAKKLQNSIDTDAQFDMSHVADLKQAAEKRRPSVPDVVADTIEPLDNADDPHRRAAATVTDIEEESSSVGLPKASTDTSVRADMPEAVYTTVGTDRTEGERRTNLTVLEDKDYDRIPAPAPKASRGQPEIPVDDDGDPVPPAVPTDPELGVPVDEFVANKLGRDTPIRLVGPHGAGKNYLLKWIAFQTNRGYRSIDVDKATVPDDLFGPRSLDEDGVVVSRDGPVKRGLLNGDLVVINEFPVMQSGAAIALHRLLNEGQLLIKSHGDLVEPHREARIAITMNPPTREYQGSEEMNAATRDRFATAHVPYLQDVQREADVLERQLPVGARRVDRDTIENIVEFAHRTRTNDRMPTLSTRSLTVLLENVIDGVTPQAAVKNQLRAVAGPRQNPEEHFEAVESTV